MHLLRTALLFLSSAAASSALTITLSPADGLLSGIPGSTLSWGFSITGDTNNWFVVTSVQSSTVLVLDVLSVFVNDNSYALPPGLATPWTQSFTPNLAATAGALARYTIPPTARPGNAISGDFLVTYDLYEANPFVGGNFVSSGEFARLPFTVRVTAPGAAVPEPASLWLSASAGLLLFHLRRGRKPITSAQTCHHSRNEVLFRLVAGNDAHI